MKNIFKKFSTGIIISLALLFAYLPAFVWMWDRWFAKDSYYSHGILVPFVSAYLIWMKREELRRIRIQSSGWGIPLIITGVLVHILSSLFRVYFSSAFSFLIVFVGIILHFYGTRVLRCILFPILFLSFMMPLPLVVIVNISFQMKLFAAEIARWTLVNMGFAAIREGSIIKLPHAYVVVDDVCSGLRSLISLTALAGIFAYWFKGHFYKRVLIFFSAIPIAVVTNVCRVVFLSFVSEIWGPQSIVGFLHDFSGFMVFALAFLMLYGVVNLLE